MDTNPEVGYKASDADWETLRKSRPEDYDGHSEFGEVPASPWPVEKIGFDRMTPAERLRWLDETVMYMFQSSMDKPDSKAKLASSAP